MREGTTQLAAPRTRGAELSYSVLIAGAGLLLGGAAQAQPQTEPHEQDDGTSITLGGVVESATPSAFTLDYGAGLITVEIDDPDAVREGEPLETGDNVTVKGRVDDDFFDAARIEAESVYVERLGRELNASSADEEDIDVVTATPMSMSSAMVQGVVSEVDDGRFVVDAGGGGITIDVASLPHDPLAAPGDAKIEVGDIVRVEGTLGDRFMQARELTATSVTTLVEARG